MRLRRNPKPMPPGTYAGKIDAVTVIDGKTIAISFKLDPPHDEHQFVWYAKAMQFLRRKNEVQS